MAIYRTIQLSFWTDEKVLDDFTPEDKYFYLYLFTNPQTNLCGCYELGWTSTTGQLGYNKDTVIRLLERFENVHKVLKYSKETKEVLLLNWSKYNWTTSKDFLNGLDKQIACVKNQSFRKYLEDLRDNKTVYRPSEDGRETSVTVTVNNTVSVSDSLSNISKDIIDYLNNKLGSKYRYQSTKTQGLIKARLNEGFTLDDFKEVIDKKCEDWINDKKMCEYLRPETLFSNKFEGYLNQKVSNSQQSYVDMWRNV